MIRFKQPDLIISGYYVQVVVRIGNVLDHHCSPSLAEPIHVLESFFTVKVINKLVLDIFQGFPTKHVHSIIHSKEGKEKSIET